MAKRFDSGMGPFDCSEFVDHFALTPEEIQGIRDDTRKRDMQALQRPVVLPDQPRNLGLRALRGSQENDDIIWP